MYQIYAEKRSVAKDFDKLNSFLCAQQQTIMMRVLATSPKATQASGGALNKVEKRDRFWQYFAAGENKVSYDAIEHGNMKQVLILFARNHDAAKIFLREHR